MLLVLRTYGEITKQTEKVTNRLISLPHHLKEELLSTLLNKKVMEPSLKTRVRLALGSLQSPSTVVLFGWTMKVPFSWNIKKSFTLSCRFCNYHMTMHLTNLSHHKQEIKTYFSIPESLMLTLLCCKLNHYFLQRVQSVFRSFWKAYRIH